MIAAIIACTVVVAALAALIVLGLLWIDLWTGPDEGGAEWRPRHREGGGE